MIDKNELTVMELDALRQLQKDVATEIEGRVNAEREKASKEIRAIAQRAGIPIRDLLKISAAPAAQRARAPGERPKPKYRNPNDAGTTWSGRGGVPGWIRDYEATGKNRSELLIKG